MKYNSLDLIIQQILKNNGVVVFATNFHSSHGIMDNDVPLSGN